MLVALNVGGILWAGLHHRWSASENHVEPLSDRPGIAFGQHGLAYTDAFATHQDPADTEATGFTVEIAFQQGVPNSSFRFVAVVHSGDETSQLLIGQWRQTIIILNGADYDFSQKSPRLNVDISSYEGTPVLLALRATRSTVEVYLEGNLVATKDILLRLPTDTESGSVILGNSPYGTNPWRGKIFGFALHDRALAGDELRRHHGSWQDHGNFLEFGHASAVVSYAFVDAANGRAVDRSSSGLDLLFPSDTTFIAPRFFDRRVAGFLSQLSADWDAVLNLSGFIPFGFVLLAFLSEVQRRTRVALLLTATVVGAGLSFGVELAQGWIPSRSSSVFDFVLNVSGTSVGALVSLAMLGLWERPKVARAKPGVL